MFKGEGPLPFDWRCYIAIMVRQTKVLFTLILHIKLILAKVDYR